MRACCIPCRMPRFRERFPAAKPLIGVIHLPPLPGYAASPGLPAVIAHALAELATHRVGGLDGVLVENENDQPHRVEAARETIAAMTAVTRELVHAAGAFPVGIEILLNDPEASLAVALAAGAGFIRSDYFADAMRRPEHGEMRIAPDALLAYRDRDRRRAGADHGRHPGQVRRAARAPIACRIGAQRARARRRCHRRHGQPHRRAARRARSSTLRARAPATARC